MLFQAENYCLFSAMKGTLTFEGKLAVGAKVVRKIGVIGVNKQEEPDFVITDEAGRFSFATINRKIRQQFMEGFFISQDVFVLYQGQEYQIWHLSKGGGREYEEFGGRHVNVRCEIKDELVEVEIESGILWTSCVWDFIDKKVLK
ncbi:MAG: DUF6795 domain-containing protein [Alphaproteobacteria bacterium]|nr:DUF6795 domain-containing protein [Alphaproteobacteria bacterium]